MKSLIFFLAFFCNIALAGPSPIIWGPGCAFNLYTNACIAGGGSGTVTSVGMTVPSFLSVSGSPITTSGTLALTFSGTAIPIANGGTGATTANSAFNNLAPAQAGEGGKFLTTDGTDTSWATLPPSGLSNPLLNNVWLKWEDDSATERNILRLNDSNIIQFGQSDLPFQLESSSATINSDGDINLNSQQKIVFNSITNVLEISGDGATAAELRFYDDDADFYTGIKAAGTTTASVTYSLPSNIGSAGQVLTDVAGDGVLSWTTPSVTPTFPILAPDGTLGAPSYSFSGSPDSGMYASGSSIGFVADNNLIMAIHSSGGIRMAPNGDAVADLGAAGEPWKDFYTKNAFIRYGELRFFDSDKSNYISLYPAATISANFALQLPTADGADSTALITDGAGVLSFGVPKSPQGTLCGWYNVGTSTLISTCKGSDPDVSCPSGYTQQTTALAKFCTAN